MICGDDNLQYVLDTSILVEMSERYYPEIFPSFWDKISELINGGFIVSLTEVQKELDKGKFSKEWDLIHIRSGKKFFSDFEGDELLEIHKIIELDIYSERFRSRNGGVTSLEKEWGSYGEVVADPFLICHGLYYNSTVVTMENPNKGHNIPHVCHELNVRCIGLKEFLKENHFKF